MTRGDKASLGFSGARSAWQGPDRRRETYEIEALPLEGIARPLEPGSQFRRSAALEGDLDQAGIAAVNAAQEVDRIGEVTA